jgi:hypothetical protein
MSAETTEQSNNSPAAEARKPIFGATEMRLNARQWLVVGIMVLIVVTGLPRLWKSIERFPTGPDYRIPYALSSDYWLYQRRLEGIPDSSIPVLGDSVVWGEYVLHDGTLTHFLNQLSGHPDQFLNCGVNGLFPLSLEGLVASYTGPLSHRKVIVHCNVLWMSSPKADLSTDKEESFNHSTLVPQFFPSIPCYKADATTRLGAIANRRFALMGWVNHLDTVYFDQRSIPRWTLEQDSSEPPQSPNAWRNPLSRITLRVPGEPATDPQRGPASPRHKPWTSGGTAPTHFEWVGLDKSLQWQAFQRTVKMLRSRDDNVFVVIGPFNEHMIAPDQIAAFRQMRDGIEQWLTSNRVSFAAPATLPSDLYADDSHPLTDGYALMAKELWMDPAFQAWLGKP